MKTARNALLVLLVLLLLAPGSALAQSYSFTLTQETVDVYWEEDGTATIEYVFVFDNDSTFQPIEFVDVGIPNGNFSVNNISAEVDGNSVSDISRSDYQGDGTGVAVDLRPNAIDPGRTGTVRVVIREVEGVLRTSEVDNYASGVFSPTWFDSSAVHGNTDMTVTFHLPPGIQTEEPRWHEAPSGFSAEPETGLDEQGRVIYTWRNPQAEGDTQYEFGASFPLQYVPAAAVSSPSFWETIGVAPEDLIGITLCCGFGVFFAGIFFASFRSTQKRKMQYMPPKIAIEGHGIKRGLTAVEAAVLLEESLDKVMTMILFAVLKKNVAQVVTQEPLELEVDPELPSDLHPYESKFLEAFKVKDKVGRRKLLQEMSVDLIKSVSGKMKGFSRKETVAYYRDIMNRAWAQVEAANTPEVKSEKYNEVMEWTMLDKNYGERTRDVFRGGPVYVPVWWPRYDPVYRGGGVSRPTVSGPSTSEGGGGVSMPTLPGSAFAGSVVGGVQNFAQSVIGNVTDFTSSITQRTNPPPPPTTTSRGGGGRSGGGCACACACAGCACACAGGGR